MPRPRASAAAAAAAEARAAAGGSRRGAASAAASASILLLSLLGFCVGLAGAFFAPGAYSSANSRAPHQVVQRQRPVVASGLGIHGRPQGSTTARPLSLTYPVLEEEDEEAEGQEGKMPSYTEADRKHMRRALELAAKALGKTRPNPAVGCVVLDADGKVVGEGFHPKVGEPHAEVFALREAGEKAKGGTAYVTLEPCNHHGRTPPCVDALLNAGVKKVVAGMVDPFPLVGGKGLARLAEHGVEVVVGCEEERCREMNRPFLHRVRYGLPLGFLPLAYADHAFQRPTREVIVLGEGPKVLKMADAVVVMQDPTEPDITAGLAALEAMEAAGDLQDSVVRVIVAADPSALPAADPIWDRAGAGGRRVVVLVPAGGKVEGLKGVEVLEGGVGHAAVGKALQEMGMLSALWLLGPTDAAAAVKAGVVHELWVRAPLKDADELDGVETEGGELSWAAKRFGRPMKVSVMSCDALGSQACVLTLEVDEDAVDGDGEA